MTESLQENSQLPPKSKSFLDYFRSKDPVPATDDASGPTSVPASNAAAEPPTADLTQQRKQQLTTLRPYFNSRFDPGLWF